MAIQVELTKEELRVLQYSLWATRDALDIDQVPEHDTEQVMAQGNDLMITNNLLLKLFGSTEEGAISQGDLDAVQNAWDQLAPDKQQEILNEVELASNLPHIQCAKCIVNPTAVTLTFRGATNADRHICLPCATAILEEI